MSAPRYLLALVLACLGLAVPATPAGAAGWTPRPEQYPNVLKQQDLDIPMSDGVKLRGDLYLPADANNVAVPGRRPVVVEITAYNKGAVGSAGGIGGAPPDYLVKRGYAFLLVDARGTGTSPGTWQIFGAREQLDDKEVMEWAADQAFSDGRTAMVGPSYMGISQLFAAGQQPHGLKAIFPQVPSAEVYRDVVASGGQLDVGFMPLWLGLVSFTSLIPAPDPSMVTLMTIIEHLNGTGGKSLTTALAAMTGGSQAYDGPWYQERSTLTRSVPHITVPTFIVGGEYDLFQRGEPLIFQALHDRGVPVKMVFGPWNHLQGSSAADIGKAGYGSIEELQLRWFDHYVRGVPDPTLDSDIPDFTYYELGSGRWVRRNNYLSDQVARVYSLSGTAMSAGAHGALTEGTVHPGTGTILPVATAGLCSRSASQWTAGTTGTVLPNNPCDTNGTINDATATIFETAPLSRPLHMLGPIAARLYTSSTTGDGLLAVNVSRVDAAGNVDRLTGGWQVMSLSDIDMTKSVTLPETRDRWTTGARVASSGTAPRQVVQPWHPFTKASQRVRKPGEVTPVDVEIFPTGAVIPAGQRLRISITAFDLPHLAPTLGQLPTLGSVLTIHESPTYPSRLVIPTWGSRFLPPAASVPPATATHQPATTPKPHHASGSSTATGQAAAAPSATTTRTPQADLPDAGAPANLWRWGALGLGMVLLGHTFMRVRRTT